MSDYKEVIESYLRRLRQKPKECLPETAEERWNRIEREERGRHVEGAAEAGQPGR